MLSKELDARKFISTWYSSWYALLNVFWLVVSYLVHLVPFYPHIGKGLRELDNIFVKCRSQQDVESSMELVDERNKKELVT
jgi:hypothetical protein